MNYISIIHFLDLNSDWITKEEPEEIIKREQERKKITEFLKKDKEEQDNE